jgi:hypothetical protein
LQNSKRTKKYGGSLRLETDWLKVTFSLDYKARAVFWAFLKSTKF